MTKDDARPAPGREPQLHRTEAANTTEAQPLPEPMRERTAA